MKTTLSGGKEAKVFVKFGEVSVPKKKEEVVRRTTSLKVSLPDGMDLTSEAVCSEKDTFSKLQGRKAALVKLLNDDTAQAQERAVQEFNRRKPVPKTVPTEGSSLASATKGYYRISRGDRRILFSVVCPEFYRNTPERRLFREKALYERLKSKFEPAVEAGTSDLKIAAK